MELEMIETELELVTLDNISLSDYYIKDLETVEDPWRSRYNYTLVPAFGEPKEYKETTSLSPPYYAVLTSVFTFEDYPTEKDVISMFDLKYKTLKAIRKQYPKIADVLEKMIPKDYFEKRNAEALAKREKNKARIQKQYDELVLLFTELGSKSDLKTMEDINSLKYCEAEGFINKIEDRINKKSNPKNLRLYTKLMEIRGKETISCKD